MQVRGSGLTSPLIANAVFSLLTAAPLLFAPHQSAVTLGFKPAVLLFPAGLILLLHAIILLAIASRPSKLFWTKMNLFIIAPYPLFILALIAMGNISGTAGMVFAVSDALIVGAIALWQLKALSKIGRHDMPEANLVS